jgi:hypothetical protein
VRPQRPASRFPASNQRSGSLSAAAMRDTITGAECAAVGGLFSDRAEDSDRGHAPRPSPLSGSGGSQVPRRCAPSPLCQLESLWRGGSRTRLACQLLLCDAIHPAKSAGCRGPEGPGPGPAEPCPPTPSRSCAVGAPIVKAYPLPAAGPLGRPTGPTESAGGDTPR